MQINVYKTNSFFKPLLYLVFIVFSISVQAQEICDNGVDDDNDGLIDLNDNECDCPTTVALTEVTGYICKNNLKLTIDFPSGTSFQWFKDGVAISGKTWNFIELAENATVEGDYVCRITTDGDCVQTIPFEVIIPDPIEVDLGEVYICPGECVTFGIFTLCEEGRWQNDNTSVNGCDSTTYMELIEFPPTRFEFTDSICTGQTYVLHGISATEQGIYRDTIENHRGCDSIITVDLRVLDIFVDTIRESICQGDTINILDVDYFAAGQYSGSDTTDTGCLVDVTIYIEELSHSGSTRNESICQGDTLRIFDIVATEAGTYQTTLVNAIGCDSIISVDLEILQASNFAFADTICSGNTFQYFDIVATEAGTYHDTITNAVGCDSIITVFLSVFDEVEFTINETICQGDSIVLNGKSFTIEGSYFEEIDSPTGCDSLVTLNLTVNRPTGNLLDETICLGEIYTLYDISESTSGRYKTTITNAVGCDSVITVDLTVQDPQDNVFSDTICFGSTYILHDIEANTAGQYSTTVQTPEGCDSLITVNLHVNDIITNTIFDTICAGVTYTHHDISESTSGSYTTLLKTAEGCDSSLTVNLHVNDILTNTIFDTICAGATYMNRDIEESTSGIYTTLLQTAEGCDSSLTVNLHVNDILTSTVFDTICAGATYTNGDISTSTAGQYTTALTTDMGCDSILTVDLFVTAPIEVTIQEEICDGATFILNDISETSAGTYITTLTTSEGCDSIVTVELSISDPIVEESILTMCEEEIYVFNEHTISESGSYTSLLTTAEGCDSTAILNVTVNPLNRLTYDMTICDGDVFVMNDIEALTTGTYTTRMGNTGGCDSLITVNLTVNSLGDHIELGENMDLSLGYDIDVIPEYLYENLIDLEWYDRQDNYLGDEEALYNFAPIDDTWVFLEGIDDNGCPAMDSLMIRVNLDVVVTIPNIISPNGDSSNDFFILGANNAVTSIEKVMIYDRWGELVHVGGYSEDVDNYKLWDGMYNGEEAAQGVYAYYIQVNILDDTTREYYGDVTVIR